jgi:hypothetical protein
MKILVLGAPYSGLRAMFNMLQAAGYKVGFEKPDVDGMVRTTLFADEFYIAGYSRVYHIVSNPLICIDALYKERRYKEYQLHMAVDLWVKTNQRIKSLSDETARIEFIKQDWPSEMFKPKRFSRFQNTTSIKDLTLMKLKLETMGSVGITALELAKQYRYEL